MFENEILQPGEKIKKYRWLLKTNQEEIALHACTKSNISQIEHGKQKLTYESAIMISKNINRIAKEKNIDIGRVTALSLLEDETTQANRMFANNYKELTMSDSINDFENKLKAIENLIENYEISHEKRLNLFRFARKFYLCKCLYSKSEKFCDKSIKIAAYNNNLHEKANIYVDKALINMNLKYYDEALFELEKAEKINNQIDDEQIGQRIYFNKALIFSKNESYDEAIKCLKELRSNYNIQDETRLIDIKILSANCLAKQSLFKTAENEYIEILDIAMKSNNKVAVTLMYRNLAEVCLNQGKYKLAEEYIEECIKSNPGDNYYNSLSETLYFSASIFKKNNKDPEKYLLKALDICEYEDIENILLLEKIMYELILIYIDKKNDKGIENIAKKADQYNLGCNVIFPILTEYYRDIDKEKSIYFNTKIINTIKKIKKI